MVVSFLPQVKNVSKLLTDILGALERRMWLPDRRISFRDFREAGIRCPRRSMLAQALDRARVDTPIPDQHRILQTCVWLRTGNT